MEKGILSIFENTDPVFLKAIRETILDSNKFIMLLKNICVNFRWVESYSEQIYVDNIAQITMKRKW